MRPAREPDAMALMQAALGKGGRGDWRGAAADLAAAAAIHAAQGRPYDEARCRQLAATLARMAGEPTGTAAAAVDDLPLAVSIQAEQAEAAHRDGRMADALAGWDVCIASARLACLGPEGMIALLGRRAEAAIALGRLDAAAEDLRRARALADPVLASRLSAVHAGHLIDAGEHERAATTLAAAGGDGGDPQTRAMLAIPQARLARSNGQPEHALDWARQARSAARAAVAPVEYLSACVECTEALETLGRRPEAYGALASAWVTLSSLIGRDMAKSWVEPCLWGLRLRWGDAAFAAAKAAHDAARRAQMAGAG